MTIHETHQPVTRALLVGAYRGGADKPACEEHLAELARLAETYGVEPVESISCPLRKVEVATYFGSGKIEELVARARELNAQLILLDDEILPGQQRNLEAAFGLTVMDRTELILEVFAAHAQTREAKLQIELAQARYQFPRLKRLWTHLSRERGGGYYLRGAGEKQIEIDRRLLQERISIIEQELIEVRRHRHIQRSGRIRSGIPTFAIVGYTNAGKSTLLNALTDAGVLVEDKLFATLDTTTRKFALPNKQEVLLVDTVGFIRKLPHQLVAAFKSTLEEATFADVLLHLIDSSASTAVAQAKAAEAVLGELHAEKRPTITVLNKIDQQDSQAIVTQLRVLYPKTVAISARERMGFDVLAQAMVEEIAAMRRELKLRIPQSQYHLVAELMQQGEVLYQEYVDNDVLLRVRVPAQLLAKFDAFVQL